MSKPAFELSQTGAGSVELTNASGQDAYDVEVWISGPVVVGGKRDWCQIIPVKADGECIKISYRTAWNGEVGDEPILHVRFRAPHNGVMHQSGDLEFKLERS